MRYFLITVAFFSFFSLPSFGGEQHGTTSQAVLTIEVTNDTANGSTVTDDEINVQIYRRGELFCSFDGKVGADGKAVFENVPTGEHTMAVAGVKHQEMMFKGRAIALRSVESNLFAKVQVFDVSEDQSNLFVSTHHMILKPRSNTLEITEYMQLVNSSDMAVRSEQRDSQDRPVVLEIMLPKGFKNLRSSSYFEEDALVVTEEGFYDTLAVPPGEYSVTFSYILEISSGSVDVVKKISLPTSNMVIFAELGQAELVGLGEADNMVIRAGGATVDYYKHDNLAVGEEIAFQITGFNVNVTGPATWVILAVAFGVVTVLVILRLRPEKS